MKKMTQPSSKGHPTFADFPRFTGAQSTKWSTEARAITPAIASNCVFIVNLEKMFRFLHVSTAIRRTSVIEQDSNSLESRAKLYL